MKQNRTIVLVAALVAGIALVDAGSAAAQSVAEGTVEWSRRAGLGMPVTGVIARVAVGPGDRVERGQVLIELDGRRFDAAVAAAQAHVAGLDPDVAEARRELERAQDLYDRTLISEHELELARIAFARVGADAARAVAMLRLAELDRESSVLRAPFAGVVVERRVQIGEVVRGQADNVPLVVLGDGSRFVARVQVRSAGLAGWSPGAAVTVVAAESRIAGKVRYVSPEPAGRSYTLLGHADSEPYHDVVVDFPAGADTDVRIGQRVRIER